jgi:hypothetical protein
LSARAPVVPFLALALVVWGAGLLRGRMLAGEDTGVAAPPWQHSFLELSAEQQRLYRALREGLYDVENQRSVSGRWPDAGSLAADEVPGFTEGTWVHRVSGVYVNYVGEAAGLRWLVLFIEPEPGLVRAPNEPAPPVDEEHHTLPNGTSLHVTVWTQSLDAPSPSSVLPFPVAEGWVQRVGR